MIAYLAGTLAAVVQVGCGDPPQSPQGVIIDMGPVDTAKPSLSISEPPGTAPNPPNQTLAPEPPRDRPLGAISLTDPAANARFRLRELVTPDPVSGFAGDRWGGAVSFAAPAESTGLAFDLSITPRASVAVDRAGNKTMSTGAELKLGPDLADRDLRGSNAAAPSWYFFVGADNEALVWNFADQRAMNGASLRDQATVGDLQTGIALSTGAGAQMSFGLVERKLEFNDVAGDKDIDRKERFAALSYTLHH
ncbi:MAG: hypothetical protein QM773_00575 [Hyphomonadaceae bacterium]